MPLDTVLGKQQGGCGGSLFHGWDNSEVHALLWLPEFLSQTKLGVPVEC